jgi:1,2-diacylglycerol 3-alpha-glucosyltransferase
MARRGSSVCWVLPDIGFYHHARIECFARSWPSPVVVLEVSDTSRFQQFKRQRSGAEQYELVTLFKSRHYEQLARHEMSQAIHKALDEIRPDLVLLQGWGPTYSLISQRWAVSNRTPTVVTSESSWHDGPRVRFREAIKSRLVRLCSAALVGGSPHADYLAKLGMPRDRIFLGYDVVDNAYFEREARSARSNARVLRAKHGLPQSYFLASARFVEKKNVAGLLQAYATYRRMHPQTGGADAKPWDLVALGDGPLWQSICKLRSTLALESSVHLPGFKGYAELPAYYGLASAFVHPSTTEQWGLVVNEAMASGLPVLASNRCGCAPDLVRPGVNGFTFDPCDTQVLARLMLRVSSPNCQISEMGQASRRIIADWGPEKFASGLKAAAECALADGSKHATLPDLLLLRGLLLR